MAKESGKGLKPGIVLKGKTNKYIVQKELGSGSFGITYLALVSFFDDNMKDLAVKVTVKEFFMKEINDRDGTEVTGSSKGGIFHKYLEKFIMEGDKLSKMKSPRIVKVLESFRDNNTAYYVMQFLPGGSLNDIIALKGRIPERRALQYALQIAEGLEYMHSRNMLHLDMKPSNVMLDKDGNCVIIDFGLAKQFDSNGEPESSTTIGAGTRGYAPLEQAQYHASDSEGLPVTMDIYALGATLYKMLSGNVPPEASEILNEGFPRQELLSNGVSFKTVNFVEKLMAPQKKNRPQSIHILTSEILSLIHSLPEDKDTGKTGGDEDVEIVDVEETSVNPGKKEEKKQSGQTKQTDNTKPSSKTAVFRKIDRIVIKYVEKSDNPADASWFTLDAKADALAVRRKTPKTPHPIKKYYLYDKEKFDLFKKSLSQLDLQIGSSYAPRGQNGIGLKLYSGGNIVFDASTYAGDDPELIGDIMPLVKLAHKEAGIFSISAVSKNDKGKFNFKNLFINTPAWILYIILVVVLFIGYLAIDPWRGYLYDKASEWRNVVVLSSGDYIMTQGADGKDYIQYSPDRKKVMNVIFANPRTEYYNNMPLHDERAVAYVFDKDGNVDNLSFVEYDPFLMIKRGNNHIIYYKGEPVDSILASTVDFDQESPDLFEAQFIDKNYKYRYRVYKNDGTLFFPPGDYDVRVIGENLVVKEEPDGTKSFYDGEGNPVSSLNPVVLDYKYGYSMDWVWIILLCLLGCGALWLCLWYLKRNKD